MHQCATKSLEQHSSVFSSLQPPPPTHTHTKAREPKLPHYFTRSKGLDTELLAPNFRDFCHLF